MAENTQNRLDFTARARLLGRHKKKGRTGGLISF